MHPLIEEKREEIAARGDFNDATSDFDFLVEFDPGFIHKAFTDYFGLKEDLEALLGREVDILTPRSLKNPYLIKSIKNDQNAIYAS